ncbi:glycosyltransferase [uncultured Litoreibacter sp.]|uniref:glycosyltransferase n=1 Tax=uncultured Litoreibacter sp. TaxID=1392394 RepID=UPI0026378CE5|nr:glycosyltransferase [uncultured Litoreibacter sp.]
MIFVTVGTQLPFPRLVDAMDKIAGQLLEPVVAQTFDAHKCRNLIVEPMIPAERYGRVVSRARLVVSHAGIGTVLAARDVGTPVVLVPRRAELGEHRNDHQMSTVRELVGRSGITPIWNTDRLGEAIAQPVDLLDQPSNPTLDDLVSRLRSFIG